MITIYSGFLIIGYLMLLILYGTMMSATQFFYITGILGTNAADGTDTIPGRAHDCLIVEEEITIIHEVAGNNNSVYLFAVVPSSNIQEIDLMGNGVSFGDQWKTVVGTADNAMATYVPLSYKPVTVHCNVDSNTTWVPIQHIKRRQNMFVPSGQQLEVYIYNADTVGASQDTASQVFFYYKGKAMTVRKVAHTSAINFFQFSRSSDTDQKGEYSAPCNGRFLAVASTVYSNGDQDISFFTYMFGANLQTPMSTIPDASGDWLDIPSTPNPEMASFVELSGVSENAVYAYFYHHDIGVSKGDIFGWRLNQDTLTGGTVFIEINATFCPNSNEIIKYRKQSVLSGTTPDYGANQTGIISINHAKAIAIRGMFHVRDAALDIGGFIHIGLEHWDVDESQTFATHVGEKILNTDITPQLIGADAEFLADMTSTAAEIHSGQFSKPLDMKMRPYDILSMLMNLTQDTFDNAGVEYELYV